MDVGVKTKAGQHQVESLVRKEVFSTSYQLMPVTALSSAPACFLADWESKLLAFQISVSGSIIDLK